MSINPQAMPDPRDPSKTLTQSELYKRATEETQFKINSLDYTQEGAREKLEEWQALIESMVFEGKAIGTRITAKLRELDEKSGKNRWDKETRGINKSNGSTVAETLNKVKKTPLTPLEKQVQGWIDTEDESEPLEERNEYILSLTVGKKNTKDEVLEALRRLRAKGTVIAKKQED